MISFRGLWIIQRKRTPFLNQSDATTSQSEFYDYSILFSKQYPTVNQRMKKLQGMKYSQLPKDFEMLDYFQEAIEFASHSSKEIIQKETVTVRNDSPFVFTLSFLGKDPLYCVFIHSNNVFYITIPALLQTDVNQTSLNSITSSNISSLTSVLSSNDKQCYIKQKNVLISISFLEGIQQLCSSFFDDEKKKKKEYEEALNFELGKKLQIVCPYGTPLVSMDNEWIKNLTKTEEKKQKIGKLLVQRKFTISEKLIYSNEDSTQDMSLNIVGFKGVVVGEVDLQGAPEMSLGFCLGKDSNIPINSVIQNMSLYYNAVPTSSNEQFATDIKFCPPKYPFNLCYYNVKPELSIQGTKTLQQLLAANYIIDFDNGTFKIQITIDVDPIFSRIKKDNITIEIPLYGVKLETIGNLYCPGAGQNFTQPEKNGEMLITKIMKFDETNRCIIAFSFNAEIQEDATEYMRIRKPSFISDLQNAFKPYIVIRTNLQTSLSGFNIDSRKIAIVQSKGAAQCSIHQETEVEAIIFARHLFGEINQ